MVNMRQLEHKQWIVRWSHTQGKPDRVPYPGAGGTPVQRKYIKLKAQPWLSVLIVVSKIDS